MNSELFNLIVKREATSWLKENPLLLNSQEKQKFLQSLQNYLENKTNTLDDEVYDFLVQKQLIKNKSREETFLKYLINKYHNLPNLHILDVGAGRICSLSKAIADIGGKPTAIDTNIRLSNAELNKSRIKAFKKVFRCDDYSKNGIGTNIDKYDIIVGLEPCNATEHIIRQSLKYNKPFDINLCAAPHQSLNGKTFETYKEWYNYLSSISKEVSIIENDCGFIATNN